MQSVQEKAYSGMQERALISQASHDLDMRKDSEPIIGPSSSSSRNEYVRQLPILATTPRIAQQDRNDIPRITFEYSRDHVKLEYTIRCDIESINVDELPPEFKDENCLYPRIHRPEVQYRGNRLQYETECNTVGWALAQLNPSLRAKRGLLQRAVDSWRNSNTDPRLHAPSAGDMVKMTPNLTKHSIVLGVQIPPAVPTRELQELYDIMRDSQDENNLSVLKSDQGSSLVPTMEQQEMHTRMKELQDGNGLPLLKSGQGVTMTATSARPPIKGTKRRSGPLDKVTKTRMAFLRKLGACPSCRARRVKCTHMNLSLFEEAYQAKKTARTTEKYVEAVNANESHLAHHKQQAAEHDAEILAHQNQETVQQWARREQASQGPEDASEPSYPWGTSNPEVVQKTSAGPVRIAPSDSAYGSMATSGLDRDTGQRAGNFSQGRQSPVSNAEAPASPSSSIAHPPSPASYSDIGSLADRAEDFAARFADELLSDLKNETLESHWEAVEAALPSMLQEFAVRIGYEGETQLHRDIMWVAYHAADTIAKHVKDDVNEEEPSTPDERVTDDGISLIEKMDLLMGMETHDTPKEYEGVDLDTIEIDPYSQILHDSKAFSWLLSTMRRNVELNVSESEFLHSIRGEVLAFLREYQTPVRRREKPKYVEATLKVQWDPRTFMDEQSYGGGTLLGSVITLTGDGAMVQALPCRSYMEQTWPSTGSQTLNALEQALASTFGFHEAMLDDGTMLAVDVIHLSDRGTMYVVATGTPFSIAEIAQQLAWLGAALRSPVQGRTAFRAEPRIWCHRTITMGINFSIDFELSPIKEDVLDNTRGLCWHALFDGRIAAGGFPIPKRAGQVLGLEIPLDIVAALTYAPKVVEFNNILCIKGFSTLLYPTKVENDMIIWHLIYNRGGSRVAYSDIRVGSGSALLSGGLRYADLEHARHIIGWCDQVIEYTGARDANFSIAPSWLGGPRAGWALEKVQISGGQYIVAAATFSLGKKDRPLYIKRDHFDYVERLEWINEKYVVLYDTQDRIAWLVDGPSALLHLVRASIEKDKGGDFGHLMAANVDDIIEPTNFQTGRAAAIQILTNEQNLRVKIRRKLHSIDNPTGDVYTFKDRVDSIFRVLEQIIDHQKDERPDGIGLHILNSPSQRLEGWDFMDVALCPDPFHPKTTTLSEDGKGWSNFVREIGAVVLFGNGFGELLRPAATTTGACRACLWNSPAAKDNDLLAVSVNNLARLRSDNLAQNRPQTSWSLKGKFHWDSPHKAFSACPCVVGQLGEARIQMLLHKPVSRSGHQQTQVPTIIPENGAVLFGYTRNVLHKRSVVPAVGSCSTSQYSSTLSTVGSQIRAESSTGSGDSSRQTSTFDPASPFSTESSAMGASSGGGRAGSQTLQVPVGTTNRDPSSDSSSENAPSVVSQSSQPHRDRRIRQREGSGQKRKRVR